MSKIIDNAYLDNSVVFDADYRTGSIADKSPYKAAATVTAPVSWTRTKYGNAIQCQNPTGLISYADNVANRLAGSNATFICLGNLSSLAFRNQILISKRGAAGSSYSIQAYYSGAQKRYYLYDGTNNYYCNVPSYGNSLIVITLINGFAGLVYVDGTYIGTMNGASTIPSTTSAITIGNYYDPAAIASCLIPLHRVVILNKVITAPEISQLYTELTSESYPLKAYSFGSKISAPKDPPGVTALLKTDFTTRLPDGRLADLSGNGWHGTIKQGLVAGPGMCGNSLVATSATRSYVDFGDVTPINGAQKLSVIWYGKRGASNPGEVVLSKANAANARIAAWFSPTVAVFNIVDGKSFSASDSNVGVPLCAGWVFDGSKVEAQRGQIYLDNSKLTTAVSAGLADTLPNNAGISLEIGRMGYTTSLPPCDRFEGLAIYPTALTPEQYLHVYKQIARRSTFALDMQRVPVSLANIVGPCEVPGTPFRANLNTTWKITEDNNLKHWLEYITGSSAYECYMKNTQAYGTWIFDYYHAATGGYCFFISNTTQIASSSRNSYAITMSASALNLIKYSPSGASTTLLGSTGAISVGNSYTIAVSRNSSGIFTVYYRLLSDKNFTQVTATSGSNPSTDTSYTTSSYFFFGSSSVGNKFSNPRFFQGVLTASDLDEVCPNSTPP